MPTHPDLNPALLDATDATIKFIEAVLNSPDCSFAMRKTGTDAMFKLRLLRDQIADMQGV